MVLICLTSLYLGLAGCGSGTTGVSNPPEPPIIPPPAEGVVILTPKLTGVTRAASEVTHLEVTVFGEDSIILGSQWLPFQFSKATSVQFKVVAGHGLRFGVTAGEFTGLSEPVNVLEGHTPVPVTVRLSTSTSTVDVAGSIVDMDGGPPAIIFTSVPALGSFNNLKGRVKNVLPWEVKVIVYIRVGSTWWVKPYANTPFTPVNLDGTFIVDVTTGGIDERANAIAAWLVKKEMTGADLHGLPPDPPTDLVLAKKVVER